MLRVDWETGNPICSLLKQLRQLRLRPHRRRGEVEAQVPVLGVADEVPVRGEMPAVAVAGVVENHTADLADAGGEFEHFDECLGGEAAGDCTFNIDLCRPAFMGVVK